MPVYRTPDGRVVEERTKHPPLRPPRKKSPSSSRTAATAARPPGPQRYAAPTAVGGRQKISAAEGDGRTIVAGGVPGRSSEAGEAPLAGWLVIVEGPGAGRDLRIGVGRNELGRNSACRIALPFGDLRISRREHLFLNYDPENRVFSATPGSGPNLSFCNGTAIVERRELASHDVIRCGRTHLRFVALCGEEFNWPDED